MRDKEKEEFGPDRININSILTCRMSTGSTFEILKKIFKWYDRLIFISPGNEADFITRFDFSTSALPCNGYAEVRVTYGSGVHRGTPCKLL
jgi:hypothetical protein